ncbi:MAG TPA: molybdopterin-dependent oxidoreductase, partial [Ktedonobacterales bacterium]|nr:molybdopterin-dependent oxidoreductase [Ktedonobacterales bacterium]
GLAFATGLISLVSGQPSDWLIFALHGALGLWLALLLWGKLRRTLPRLARPRLWDRRMLIGIAVTVFVLLALGTGVWWVFAGDLPLAIFNLLGWHIILGFGLTALVALHMLARIRPLRRRVVLGRRQALRFGALLAGGLVLWPAQQLANRLLGLPGASRRFTGSYEAASYQGNVFPSTSWVADQPRPITSDGWRLTIGGAVAHPLTLTYTDLLTLGANGLANPTPEQLDQLDALLDCTGGFYSAQHWRGVRVGRLLDHARSASGVTYVRFISVTGYRWSLPLAEARDALLATHLDDEPISDAHGFPVRLVAPGRRGFEWVKWVTRVEALTQPDPGEVIAINTSWLTPVGRGA